MWSGAVVCPASKMRHVTRRGPVWRCADRVQNRLLELGSSVHRTDFPDPVSMTVCPCLVLRPAHIPDVIPSGCSHSSRSRHGIPVGFFLRHQRPGDARHLVGQRHSDQFLGLRASMRASHEPSRTRRRMAQRISAAAPTINSRLKSRWPILDILPSRGLPPVECCRGTSPSQAEKSRPRRKLSIGGAKAWIAVALIGPIPGMVIRRRASSSWRTCARICFSRSLICALRLSICANRRSANSRTRSGSHRLRIRNDRRQQRNMSGALGRNNTELRQVAPQRIDRSGSADEPEDRVCGTACSGPSDPPSSPPQNASSGATPPRRWPRHPRRRSCGV